MDYFDSPANPSNAFLGSLMLSASFAAPRGAQGLPGWFLPPTPAADAEPVSAGCTASPRCSAQITRCQSQIDEIKCKGVLRQLTWRCPFFFSLSLFFFFFFLSFLAQERSKQGALTLTSDPDTLCRRPQHYSEHESTSRLSESGHSQRLLPKCASPSVHRGRSGAPGPAPELGSASPARRESGQKFMPISFAHGREPGVRHLATED